MKECELYTPLDSGKVRCFACAHKCMIADGSKGICRVRENRSGKLFSQVYGLPVSCAIDPVEKKPLYHFMSGSNVYSIGTVGCNFKCDFCQNHDIAFSEKIIGKRMSPEEIVEDAVLHGCRSIAYTYNEPAIFIEMVHDIAVLARKRSLKNIMVTNGYMTPESLEYVSGCIDAMNIDLKSFDDGFYRRLCGARLKPVLECIRKAYAMGIHIELTTLVIPGENDSEEELREIARFIAALDRSIPWHVSRFFPMHNMKEHDATSRASIMRACEIGNEEGLENVHAGNI